MKRNGISVKSGFTLMELLLVVGVLSILIGLLTPAILKSMKTAQRRDRAAERKLLEGAIVEYWHDMNRWPLPSDPGLDGNYKASFRDYRNDKFNNLVFDQLLGVTLPDGTKKDYVDPSRHITTADSVSDFPAFSVASLKDAAYGNQENGIAKRANRILVYWSDFIECPECDENDPSRFADLDARECSNPDCNYPESHDGAKYRFTPADRKGAVRGLRPYNVTIDLLNNTVKVEE